MEIEVGERRSGIIEESDFLDLPDSIKKAPHVHLKGVFSHEGHCYNSPDLATCRKEFIASSEAYPSVCPNRQRARIRDRNGQYWFHSFADA